MLEIMSEIEAISNKFKDKMRACDVRADQEIVMTRPDSYKIGFYAGQADAFNQVVNVLNKYKFVLEEKLPKPLYEDMPDEERTLDDDRQYEMQF